MRQAPIPELHYRAGGAARGHFPGHHRSRRGDSGSEFRGHVPLIDAPDPRRLDLHASLRDPFGRWLVHLRSQRMAIPVAVVADLSASMAFEGPIRKRDVLADFVQSLAWSAWRTGDSFGFVGCDEAVRTELLLPQTRARGAGIALAERLRTLALPGRSSLGLQQAQRFLPSQRALVFLVSDFHWPLAQVKTVLGSLAHHELVPVLLWQPQEFDLGAQSGLVHMADAETGRMRWLWWRPVLRERWRDAQQRRRADLLALMRGLQLAPLVIEGAFDAEAVTRHFHS